MLRIRHMHLKYASFLAPMASLTDIVFRRLVDEIGSVGALVTELISAEGVSRGNRRTLDMMQLVRTKTPQFIQLFSAEPEPFVAAVEIIKDLGFAGIDLNMGCPANKVVKRGAGAALLDNPLQMARIIAAVRRATDLILTVKLRLGVSAVNILENLKIVAAEGADAVAVHFRLKNENYADPARWEWAGRVMETASIPVIGNGDIWDAETGLQKLQLVDAVMIGRGAVANPLIFRQIAGRKIGPDERSKILDRFFDLIEEHYEPALTLPRLKASTRFLVSRKPGAKQLRREIYSARSLAEAREGFRELLFNGTGSGGGK